MLTGLLTLLGFQLLGEALQRLLGLPLPGPVIGMFLLFGFLCLRGEVPEHLETGSQRLIDMMPLLFMAPAAGVFFLGAGFADQWPGFLAAVTLGTVFSLIFSGLLLKALTKKRDKHGTESQHD